MHSALCAYDIVKYNMKENSNFYTEYNDLYLSFVSESLLYDIRYISSKWIVIIGCHTPNDENGTNNLKDLTLR